MNCVNCGNALIPGNDTCPNCGALNMSFEPAPTTQEVAESMQNVNAAPVETLENQVAENIAAPSLDVEEEHLEDGIEELDSTAPEETYETLEDEQIERDVIEELDVQISIPSASENSVAPVAAEVAQGDVQTLEAAPTVGSSEITVPVKEKHIKIGGKTVKVKLGGFRTKDLIIFGSFFAIGLFIGYLTFGNRTTSVCYQGANENTKLVSDGKNNETYINSFKYKIPKGYIYDVRDSGIIVYSEDLTKKIYIRSLLGSYDLIAKAQQPIKDSLIDNGIAVASLKELVVNSHKFIVGNVTINMGNRTIAVTEGKEGRIFYVEIMTSDNNYDKKMLELADDIINNADFVDKVSSIEGLQIKNLADLLNTIGEKQQAINNE